MLATTWFEMSWRIVSRFRLFQLDEPELAVGGRGIDHPDLLTVYGSVEVAAATVKIGLQDGSALTAPVAEHFFLVSIPKPAAQGDAKLERVTAFDATGTKVAEWTPSQ